MGFDDDKRFDERFRAHFIEIMGLLAQRFVAPSMDDFKYNTDFGMYVEALDARNGEMSRFATRVRRAGERQRRDSNGHPRTHEFTIRHSRPSGHETEMDKMKAGWGDYMIYGFESTPGSDRLYPWTMLRLSRLTAWDPEGQGWRSIQHNTDDSSDFAVYWLEDIPSDVVLHSDGVPRSVIQSPGSTIGEVIKARYCKHGRPLNPPSRFECPYCVEQIDDSDFFDMMRFANRWRRDGRKAKKGVQSAS
jgi:hypothetical protein